MNPGLAEWLRRLEQRAPEEKMEPGLERTRAVLARMGWERPAFPIITVGGTNGKGSVVAMIEAMGRAAGLSTVAYTSPQLLEFSERIRIDGRNGPESLLAEAIAEVEQARGEIPLTHFEHVTLAALVVARVVAPQLLVLEVGMGGLRDAVNVVDPDVSILTSIGLDHTEWLGPTRLHIGREKAGIARCDRPLIVGERRLPAGLEPVLRATGARLALAGRDFHWRRLPAGGLRLRWNGGVNDLPAPSLAGTWQLNNAACAMLALLSLECRLGVDPARLAAGLEQVHLPGRLQRALDRPAVWLDVAHNAAGARALAGFLGPCRAPAASTAVFSALADKDVGAMGRALKVSFNRWLVADLVGARARPAREQAAVLSRIPVAGQVETLESVAEALQRALQESKPSDRIVVFGSFRTVAAAAGMLRRHQAWSD